MTFTHLASEGSSSGGGGGGGTSGSKLLDVPARNRTGGPFLCRWRVWESAISQQLRWDQSGAAPTGSLSDWQERWDPSERFFRSRSRRSRRKNSRRRKGIEEGVGCWSSREVLRCVHSVPSSILSRDVSCMFRYASGPSPQAAVQMGSMRGTQQQEEQQGLPMTVSSGMDRSHGLETCPLYCLSAMFVPFRNCPQQVIDRRWAVKYANRWRVGSLNTHSK